MSQNRSVILFYLQQIPDGLSEKELLMLCYPDYHDHKFRKSRGGWMAAMRGNLSHLRQAERVKRNVSTNKFLLK